MAVQALALFMKAKDLNAIFCVICKLIHKTFKMIKMCIVMISIHSQNCKENNTLIGLQDGIVQ